MEKLDEVGKVDAWLVSYVAKPNSPDPAAGMSVCPGEGTLSRYDGQDVVVTGPTIAPTCTLPGVGAANGSTRNTA